MFWEETGYKLGLHDMDSDTIRKRLIKYIICLRSPL